MGGLLSFCTDPNDEKSKPGALMDTTGSSSHHSHILVEGGPTAVHTIASKTLPEEQKHREEEQRLQLLVGNAGRDMVSVRSTRGATYYHDQGFAAALSQHLQQTLPDSMNPNKLPAPSQNCLQLLSRPVPTITGHWEVTHVANAQTTKEQLFANSLPIVESLL
jgi:hypothetical protein